MAERRVEVIDEALRVLVDGTEAELFRLLCCVEPTEEELTAAEGLLLLDAALEDGT